MVGVGDFADLFPWRPHYFPPVAHACRWPYSRAIIAICLLFLVSILEGSYDCFRIFSIYRQFNGSIEPDFFEFEGWHAIEITFDAHGYFVLKLS